jgi:secretion/DNA translocation related TadE-like protein
LIGVVVISMVAVLWLGAAAVAKTRAQTAADMAALAGAQALLDHLPDAVACDHAATVADAHGAQLTGCAARGDQCEVTAAVTGSPRGGTPAGMTARARAVAGRPP